MPVTVLVVDDSAFFRQRVVSLLNGDSRVRVVGTAENGRVAIEKARQLRPDVITMDYEMPVMNGVAALVEIMRIVPTPVLMFSSLTYEGARITLEALEAGAVDYLPKSYEQMAPGNGTLGQVLIERILAVAKTPISTLTHPLGRGAGFSVGREAATSRAAPTERTSTPTVRAPASVATKPLTAARPAPGGQSRRPAALRGRCSLVIIGTSTGGPVAVQKILSQIPARFPVPILIVQHMPKAFTGAFAERLNQQCMINVREAVDGDKLQSGVALLAPGGQQMMVESRNGGQVRILAGDDRLTYKPSVDITFGSAAKTYPGKVLGIVLTGMGADGREGARMLKNAGSTIWAQNEQSCVIYGMPQAVVKANLVDLELDLNAFSDAMIAAAGG